jgi:hypothetical protein
LRIPNASLSDLGVHFQYVIANSGGRQVSLPVAIPRRPQFDGLENPHLKDVLSASRIPQFQSNGQFLQGKQLYDEFTDLRKACLLNIAAKASHWTASNVWPHVRSIVRIEQDRFFVLAGGDIKSFFENEEKPVRFVSAGKALPTPVPGYQLDSSWAADIAIDEDSGIEHAFEVVETTSRAAPNPYQVHKLMLLSEPDKSGGETKADRGYNLPLS